MAQKTGPGRGSGPAQVAPDGFSAGPLAGTVRPSHGHGRPDPASLPPSARIEMAAPADAADGTRLSRAGTRLGPEMNPCPLPADTCQGPRAAQGGKERQAASRRRGQSPVRVTATDSPVRVTGKGVSCPSRGARLAGANRRQRRRGARPLRQTRAGPLPIPSALLANALRELLPADN